MEMMLSGIAGYLEALSASNPKLMAILAIAYLVGFSMKLIITSVKAFIVESPSKEDDEKLAKFEQSQAAKILYFVLDLLIRFKKVK